MVEIKELVIRASFNQSPKEKTASDKDKPYADCAQDGTVEGASEDIIEACVRQVLAILERRTER
ncbi:DUF5908 family protein [Dyadobacter sp. CY261]|uniref:DUF5908 family protein n=1 Tax=Dyadobacter sp. CY261 TaxID=2907203 RepID=UPI001F278EE1|nr:DUF5908 family protein [Dyadobacter sp. CY261]MCF0074339.1 DUF5908 family protein [Dyadobacter sp. CY261]